MIKFIGLFVVITLGVASGNLLSNFITAQVAAYHIMAAAKVAQESSERQQQISDAARQQELERQKQTRRYSDTGKRFVRECNEWQRNAANTGSSYAREQAQRRCKKKEQYIDTGSWNRSLDR